MPRGCDKFEILRAACLLVIEDYERACNDEYDGCPCDEERWHYFDGVGPISDALVEIETGGSDERATDS